MQRSITLLIFTLFSLSYAYAGERVLTIEACQESAQRNYPLIKQYQLIDQSRDYNIANANRGYIPQIALGAQATYQSDVASAPGMPKQNKDQYSVTLELNQSIWDGGVISSEKWEIEGLAEVDRKRVKVEIYAINERVNQLFFGILLLKAQLEQNLLLQRELERNHNLVGNYVENGIGSRADLDVVRVEQLKTEQAEVALRTTHRSYLEMLSILIGEKVDKDTEFEVPLAIEPSPAAINNRPELEFFEAQHLDLEGSKNQINALARPKLGLFVRGGYGRPGLNALSNKFDTYYVAGVRLSWNIGSLYTKKGSKQLIEAHQRSVAVQRETFLFNTALGLSQDRSEIERQRALLMSDDEIITLRGRIKQASESKLLNGTITVTDLMIDVTAEDMAKQQRILHEIELLQSIYNLKLRVNN